MTVGNSLKQLFQLWSGKYLKSELPSFTPLAKFVCAGGAKAREGWGLVCPGWGSPGRQHRPFGGLRVDGSPGVTGFRVHFLGHAGVPVAAGETGLLVGTSTPREVHPLAFAEDGRDRGTPSHPHPAAPSPPSQVFPC